MSGSLLGRGRSGRLVVYAGCVAVVVLLVFAYRAAVSEMARLRELHEQCIIHQESLQQRLQVIFDYKVKLEKSLADETSANAAAKQELQQQATREKSRRDKDTIEAMQRYNSLQQAHKILETEKKDLQEDCDKTRKQALDDTNRLETTLQELRAELKQAKNDKIDIDNQKSIIQEKYDNLVKTNNDVDSQNQQLLKKVTQLNKELDIARKSCSGRNHVIPSMSNPGNDLGRLDLKNDHQSEGQAGQAGAAASQNSMNLARPPSEQQVSPSSKNENGGAPEPLPAPRDHFPNRASFGNDDALPNDANSDVGFEQKVGGIIVPVGPQHAGNDNENEVNLHVLPIPYNFQGKENLNEIDLQGVKVIEKEKEKERNNLDALNKILSENVGDIPQKFVNPRVQGINNHGIDSNNANNEINSNNVIAAPLPAAQKSSSVDPRLERGVEDAQQIPIVKLQDEMQVLQDKLDGLDNN